MSRDMSGDWFCANCRSVNTPGSGRCYSCGQRRSEAEARPEGVNWTTPPPGSSPASPAPAPGSPATSTAASTGAHGVWFCQRCNYGNNPGAKWCTRCSLGAPATADTSGIPEAIGRTLGRMGLSGIARAILFVLATLEFVSAGGNFSTAVRYIDNGGLIATGLSQMCYAFALAALAMAIPVRR